MPLAPFAPDGGDATGRGAEAPYTAATRPVASWGGAAADFKDAWGVCRDYAGLRHHGYSRRIGRHRRGFGR